MQPDVCALLSSVTSFAYIGGCLCCNLHVKSMDITIFAAIFIDMIGSSQRFTYIYSTITRRKLSFHVACFDNQPLGNFVFVKFQMHKEYSDGISFHSKPPSSAYIQRNGSNMCVVVIKSAWVVPMKSVMKLSS